VDPVDSDPEHWLKGKPRLFPDEYEGVGGEPAGQVTPVLLLLLLLLRLLYDRLSVQ
jgi:hypothetical protein